MKTIANIVYWTLVAAGLGALLAIAAGVVWGAFEVWRFLWAKENRDILMILAAFATVVTLCYAVPPLFLWAAKRRKES